MGSIIKLLAMTLERNQNYPFKMEKKMAKTKNKRLLNARRKTGKKPKVVYFKYWRELRDALNHPDAKIPIVGPALAIGRFGTSVFIRCMAEKALRETKEKE